LLLTTYLQMVVMFSVASVCLSVCETLTFQSFDLDAGASSEYPGQDLQVHRVKVTGP